MTMPTLNAHQWSVLERAAEERLQGSPPAHDFTHVLRVAANAMALARSEGADVEACRAAALLHELFNYPKDHPDSARSGDVCAEHARALLDSIEADPAFANEVAAAIRDHAFSKGAMPESLTGRILQDADRLDAIGAIGVARCLATCSEMRRPFYAPRDPFCRERPPDDKLWGIDHFYKKLLRIPEKLHTEGAKRMAEPRTAFLRRFLDELERELSS